MTFPTTLAGTPDPVGAAAAPFMGTAAAELAPSLPNQAPWLESSFNDTKRLRHDGWDGPKMARFCSALADTGVVTEACFAAGMSAQSAYALRHRDPVFAGAWAAALAMGRERLADDLLARAMKGEVVQVWQNGIIVAEQHRFDNKLALAILRRLDRLAETGATGPIPRPSRGEGRPASGASGEKGLPSDSAPLCGTPALNGGWPDLLDALEQDRPYEALTLLGRSEIDEVDNPPVQPLAEAERAELDRLRARYDREQREEEEREEERLARSVWKDDCGEWKTDFPPPPGFDGFEIGQWGEADYERECSPEEIALLGEDERLALEEERAEADRARRRYFGMMAAEEEGADDSDADLPSLRGEGEAIQPATLPEPSPQSSSA